MKKKAARLLMETSNAFRPSQTGVREMPPVSKLFLRKAIGSLSIATGMGTGIKKYRIQGASTGEVKPTNPSGDLPLKINKLREKLMGNRKNISITDSKEDQPSQRSFSRRQILTGGLGGLAAALAATQAPGLFAAQTTSESKEQKPMTIIDQPSLDYLTDQARSLLTGSIIKATNGTPMYTPDGMGNYAALWTRDFDYMVEYAGDLIPLADIEACINHLIAGQRADGVIPDRVDAAGVPLYAAGGAENPVGRFNLDNGPFLVILVDAYCKLAGEDNVKPLLHRWASALARGLDVIPRSAKGLVYNDPADPHSPYGFTDTIAKTGELMKESLLFWRACLMLADMDDKLGDDIYAGYYRRQAMLIEENLIPVFLPKDAPALLAATKDCRQIDIWGNAYAVYIDFPLGASREPIIDFLVTHYDDYVNRGQVRHLLNGEYWQRQLLENAPDTYQNGGYWATASGWVMWALAQRDPALARRLWTDMLTDFKAGGICEWIHGERRQLPKYVASATNPLGAARRLRAEGI